MAKLAFQKVHFVTLLGLLTCLGRLRLFYIMFNFLRFWQIYVLEVWDINIIFFIEHIIE